MTKSKKQKKDNLAIILIILLICLIVLIVYHLGKSNGHNQYDKEHQLEIKKSEEEKDLLQTWAEDLRQKEEKLNNSEQTINNCNTNFQNLTQEYGKCKQKLDSRNSYIFNLLNYNYKEINVMIISFFIYFSLTLFELIINNKNLRIFLNFATFIFLIIWIILGTNLI